MNYDEYYKMNNDVFGEKPEKVLVKYCSKISKEFPVMDIGAGQGRNTFYLSKLGYNVVALDPSIVSVEMMKEVKKKENLTFEIFNSDFKSFVNDKSYAAILLFGLIQILDWDEIIILKDKISRWLKKGGLIFLTSFSTKDESHKEILKVSKKVGRNSYLKPNGDKRTFFEPGEIKSLFVEYEIVHYWEGLGPEHRHGNSPIERHELIEAVFKS